MTNWEELPQEILELITCRLATEDFLDFGRVCTSWQSAATKETYKAKSKAPWLMTYMRKQTAEFFSPSRERIFQLRASRVATIIELPFFERLRHKSPPTVELDVPKKLRHGPKRIHKIALSSSPSWSSHDFFSPGFSGSGTNRVCLSEIGRRCMDGSLLVAGKIKGEGDAPVIRVFKVNLEKRTQVEVNSLGNASLFLNYNSSFLAEFNAEDPESCFHGIKPNRIYFTDDMDEKKIYSMDDGTVETYSDAAGSHRYTGEWFQPEF
ncbi:hypothetical protein BT93_E1822 [Corymbia citriodora subsp. variegata]|nr:hypothetical protein BT93_E1822 [Corymbia citriodora subsp. variegata]